MRGHHVQGGRQAQVCRELPSAPTLEPAVPPGAARMEALPSSQGAIWQGWARGGKGRQEEGQVVFKEGVTFELFVATVTHLPAVGQVKLFRRRGPGAAGAEEGLGGPGGEPAVLTWATWGGTDVRTDRWARTAGPEAHPPSQHPHLSQGTLPEPPQPSLLSLPSGPQALTPSCHSLCPLDGWSAPGNCRT